MRNRDAIDVGGHCRANIERRTMSATSSGSEQSHHLAHRIKGLANTEGSNIFENMANPGKYHQYKGSGVTTNETTDTTGAWDWDIAGARSFKPGQLLDWVRAIIWSHSMWEPGQTSKEGGVVLAMIMERASDMVHHAGSEE